MSRYINKRLFDANRSKNAKELMKRRGIENGRFFKALDLSSLSVEERKSFDVRIVTWRRETRLSKLAFEFYGDSKLWWVIGWFNQKPTDSSYSVGDEVMIPFPLEDILNRIG